MDEIYTDVTIIGGGAAGYSAATQASMMGKRVVLIEKDTLGGTCVNHGCIPTKSLLYNLQRHYVSNENNPAAINIENLKNARDKAVFTVRAGMEQIISQNKITFITGKASFISENTIHISAPNDYHHTIHTNKTIIASGSIPKTLGVPGGSSPRLMYSNDLLQLNTIPKSIIIIGAGAVGLELACIMSMIGSRVTVIENMPRILPSEDEEIASQLERSIKQKGISIFTNATIQQLDVTPPTGKVLFLQSGLQKCLEAESVCICIGQKASFVSSEMDKVNVAYSSMGIKTDAFMRTSNPSIYAAGDINGRHMLAYVASEEGRIAASNACGKNETMDYSAVPNCVFTSPEVASVGLSESEAMATGKTVRIIRYFLAGNALATITLQRKGFIKFVVNPTDGRLLGAQMIGQGVTQLISECTLAIKMKSTIQDIAKTLHPHPSLSEALQEASISGLSHFQ